MRRNIMRLTSQLRWNSTRASGVQARKICPECRIALASQIRPPQAIFPRKLPTQASRALHTSSRKAQQTSASDQPRIKTLYDYFPISVPEGPPPQGPFAVDINALRREFLQLQASAHPDKHPSELKGRAETLSSLINDAYNTLKDPLRRAQYILGLRGIDVANDETAKVEDQGLLMNVLEAQEGIEEANAETDLDDIRSVNEERLKTSIAVLEDAFDKDDMDAARREAVRLRYWYNIHEGVTNWEPGKPVTLVH